MSIEDHLTCVGTELDAIAARHQIPSRFEGEPDYAFRKRIDDGKRMLLEATTHAPALLYGAVGWQGGTVQALAREIARLKRCEAALCELVALKKLKAEIEALEVAEGEPYTMARSVYEQRKALAWPLAFDLVDDVRTAVTLSAVVTRIAYLAGELVMQLSAGEEIPQHLEAGDIVQIQCGPK